MAGLACLALAVVLLRFSRPLGDLIGSFYRGPGLPRSSQPQPNRARLAEGVASFWTWGFRLFALLFAVFGLYVLVTQFV